MRRLGFAITTAFAALILSAGCTQKQAPVPSAAKPAPPSKADPGPAAPDPDKAVGYDLRRLRPTDQELGPMFAKMVERSVKDNKRPAVLFSATWCHACQDVELELGNTHPYRDIGHVRIFQLIEEDWEAVTRLDEYNDLRARWHPEMGTYPMLFLLDAKGNKVESMQEAKKRLAEAGQPVNFPTWFSQVGPL